MPSALLRPCSEPGGCPELVVRGRCPTHASAVEQRRGSAHARGYTRHWRESFTPQFTDMLIAADIAPVCGASLPNGPAMPYSQCKAESVLTAVNPDGSALHLHHDPPLQPEERGDRRAVEDPTRVGFLCASCHASETKSAPTS